MGFNCRWLFQRLIACALFATISASAETKRVWLDELPLQLIQQDFGSGQANRSAGGTPLKLRQDTYARGVGTHANSIFVLNLNGGSTRFNAFVGADNASGGSVRFHVVGDGKVLFSSTLMKRDTFPAEVDVDLTSVSQLALLVDDGGDGIGGDHANWVNAFFTVTGTAPEPVVAQANPRQLEILTPAVSEPPRLTFPKKFGVRPGSPLHVAFTATGKRPMTFAASGLPAGIALDAATGRLSGRITAPGSFNISVTATNRFGSAKGEMQLIAGETLALTPPLGWSSWNAWGGSVDQKKIQDAAESLVTTGLDQFGFCYVNIDDFWQGSRSGESLALHPNPAAFPDMPSLGNFVHSRGLKLGLYSSPWKVCYSGKPGSSADNVNGTSNDGKRDYGAVSFVDQDIALWSGWGIDFLKYDWTPNDAAHTRPMAQALKAQKRDIVLSLANAAPIWNADGLSATPTVGEPMATWWIRGAASGPARSSSVPGARTSLQDIGTMKTCSSSARWGWAFMAKPRTVRAN